LLVLLDTTVLTNFARVGLAQAIKDLWPKEACITAEALKEYQAGIRSAGLPPDAWHDVNVVKLTVEEESLASNIFSRLGVGERSCLAVALHRNSIISTDDKPARRIAKKYGIQVIGSVGCYRLVYGMDYYQVQKHRNIWKK